MALTTDTLVRGIITDAPPPASVSMVPFITAASQLVDMLLASAARDDGTAWYTSAQLQTIETWLAAHFYAVNHTRAASKAIGKASKTAQGQTAMRLEATLYGQQAMVLDISGILATQSAKRRRVRVSFLGTPGDGIP